MKTLLDTPVLFKDPNYEKKIISLDIETAPSLGTYYDPYKKMNIVWKEREWFVMGMSSKYVGKSKLYRNFIWNLPQWKKVFCKCCNKIDNVDIAEEVLIKEIWEILDKTQVVIGWNSDKFDIRKLNAKFIKYHLDPPSPYQTIDAMKLHKKIANTDTNKLGDVGEFLGFGGKKETKKELTRRCLQNDKSSQNEMEVYCDRDVILAEKIYLVERGWNKSLTPNFNLIYGTLSHCPKCGSEHINKAGFDYKATTVRQSYRCLNCGARPSGETVQRNQPLK